MSRWLTILFAAAEAVIVAAIGIAVPLALGSLVWALGMGFGPDWVVIWRAAADLWLLGHGVDITFRLDETTAAALAVTGAETPVPITIALLGIALLTAGLAVRAGRRIAEVGHPMLGLATELLVFAAAAALVAWLSTDPAADSSLIQGVLLPTATFAIGLLVGVGTVLLRPHRYIDIPDRYRRLVDRMADRTPPFLGALAGGALRAGVGAVLGLVVIASVIMTLALTAGFAQIITLYETLHTGVLGGVTLTIAQLAVLPNALVWTMSWLVGPGFQVGTGSTIGPFGTALGPLPPLPMLGAIPAESPPAAWLVLILPLAAGLVAGLLTWPWIRRDLRDWWAVLVGILGGAIGGVLVGLLAAASAGAAGPGRLAVVGPDPLSVGVWAGIEFAVSITLGLLTAATIPGLRRGRRPADLAAPGDE